MYVCMCVTLIIFFIDILKKEPKPRKKPAPPVYESTLTYFLPYIYYANITLLYQPSSATAAAMALVSKNTKR